MSCKSQLEFLNASIYSMEYKFSNFAKKKMVLNLVSRNLIFLKMISELFTIYLNKDTQLIFLSTFTVVIDSQHYTVILVGRRESECVGL